MADRLDSERQWGFGNKQTDRQTDICNSRVAFVTEKFEEADIGPYNECVIYFLKAYLKEN